MNSNSRISIFGVSRLVSRKKTGDVRKYEGDAKEVPPRAFMEGLRFVRYHFYICPNYGSKVCEQRTTILN